MRKVDHVVDPVPRAAIEFFDLVSLDIFDPGLYVESVPHERFRFLRKHDPVFWQELPAGRGFWCLTKHADVKAASAAPEVFSAELGGVVIDDLSPDQLQLLRSQLLSMDPPQHGVMRRKVLAGFTPGRVGRMEGFVRERARAVVERAIERGTVEFVHEMAAELPLQVICEILGVPAEDRPWIVEMGDRIIGRDDPELNPDDEAFATSRELGAYGFRLAMERKGSQRDDLISALLHAQARDDQVNEVEFAGLFVQIIIAGNETTRTLLSGSVLALLQYDDSWRALQREPGRLPTAIEEMLRWTTPVHYFRRTATCDTELRGKRIRRGERVVLHYTSANFDEEVFEDPYRFDIARDPNPHLAFGWGEHFCLGAKLARLEARVFWEEFFARVASAELNGPVRRMRSNLNNSHKEIPLRLFAR
ncbi:MAG TPA: cytochrome P450 [Myxococcota bacterium]|nr:cytochrome P450 [Myxococcota bacterium]